jgi:broad specificity phosphatase PhoE
MAKLYLVRHGKAKAGWDSGYDPGLDELGRQQARAAAEILAPLGPLPIVTSPMARTRETSLALGETWGRTPRIEERVSEIPSPTLDLAARTEWLIRVMGDRWLNLESELQRWRNGVIEALLEIDEDTVIFSHFIAINAAVGKAKGDDRVVVFLPDNGSITIIETGTAGLAVLRYGSEAATFIG